LVAVAVSIRRLHLAVGGQAMDQSVAAICCCLQPVTAKNSGCFRCYSAAIISKRRGIPRIGTSGPLFFRGNNSDISDERLGIVRKLAFGVGVALLVWQQIEAEETG
jgi:hypothetical protein